MDDILLKIFKNYLSYYDRLRCEAVCKRWQHLALISWKSVKALDFDSQFPFLDPKESVVKVVEIDTDLRLHALQSILQKTNGNVTELILGQLNVCHVLQNFSKKRQLTPQTIEAISKNCQNLRNFTCRRYLIGSLDPLEAILLKFPSEKLQVFKLEFCRIDVNNEQEGQVARKILAQMFQNFVNLKEFSLQGRGSCYGHLILDGNLLENLPSGIEILNLSAGQSLKLHDLNFVAKMTNLKQISLQRSNIRNQDLELLGESAEFLEFLDLSYSRSITDFGPISSIKNLKFLILDGNRDYFSDENLRKISGNCKKIEHISLDSCARLTENGLIHLQNLKYLKFLSMWGLSQVNDTVLLAVCNNCQKLEYLDVKYCRKVTKIGLNGLLELKNLQTLCVNGIADVDLTFLDRLKSVTKLKKLEAIDCKGLGRTDLDQKLSGFNIQLF